MSKDNLALARKIVANVSRTQEGEGWRYELMHVIGQDYLGVQLVEAEYEIKDAHGKGKHGVGKGQGHGKTTKKEADEIVAKQIAAQLDDGTLVLHDDWEKINLG